VTATTPTLDGAGTDFKRKNHGRNHSYWLGDKKLDGVTTLIGDGMRKKALEAWNARITAEYAVDNWASLNEMSPSQRLAALGKAANANRDEAARRGTEIHRLAEALVAGQTVEVPDEIRGHVDSAVRFLDEWQIRPILTETSVFHRTLGYGGTLDLVVTSDLRPGVVSIVDWKSSRSGIFGETALQLCAYGMADAYVDEQGVEHPMSELGINEALAVWVRADGYSVYPMQFDEETFRTFQYVATVARRTARDRMDDLKGAELFRPTGVAA
jgi:hypothetical protein